MTSQNRKSNMKKLLLNLLLIVLAVLPLSAQEVVLEGYAFEGGNRGYLNEVQIIIKDSQTKQTLGTISSNLEGKFTIGLPKGNYIVEATKDVFHPVRLPISLQKEKEYIKIKMERKPGYIFDVTMAEKRINGKEQVDAIEGARVEVYNNTKQAPVIELNKHPQPTFKVDFQRGNHYTIMIRKEGFFTKRLEAYVDIKGCILCFDGVGNVQPGVSDVLTDQNQMGTLLANIELQPIVMDAAFELKNIYYDLNSSRLRTEATKELESLITLLKDNPGISVEIGSHTDARGEDRYNKKLSQKRAQAVVDYLVDNGNIDPTYLIAKGYGEQQLVNTCKNGVKCSERKHQQNRRTELKVVGIEEHAFSDRRLAEIIQFESLSDEIIEVGTDGQIKIPEGETIPEEILKDIKKTQATASNTNATERDGQKPSTNDQAVNKPTSVQSQKTRQQQSPPPASPVKRVNQPATNSTAISKDQANTTTSQKTITTQKPVAPKAIRVNAGETLVNIPKNTRKKNTTSASSKKPTTKQIAPPAGEISVNRTTKLGKTKSVPAGFTGYFVEILVVNQAITEDNEIFQRHGNIYLEKKANSEHTYMLGSFKEKKDAAMFLKEVILKRYPTARLVYFLKGKRIGYTRYIPPKKNSDAPR